MNTWKAILATLVIFIAGVTTGGLFVSHSDQAREKPRRSPPRENPNRPPGKAPAPGLIARDGQRLPNFPNRLPHGLNMEFLQKLDREVHLTSEQRERIEKIITAGQQRNKELWERIAPELRREMAETQKRIRDELTPEQQARFEELMKQRPPRKGDESHPRDQRRPVPPRDAPSPNAAQPRSPENP